MLGNRIVLKRRSGDEGERPFWISFADLMTALMVLFLLVMSVTLLAVTKTISETERMQAESQKQIDDFLNEIEKATKRFPGISVDRKRKVIDFGTKANFENKSHKLTTEQEKLLRAFVPEVLAIARSKGASRWLKRIVVEGFTDRNGTYLYNLNLSLQRSQRVLCVLLSRPLSGERIMTPVEQEQIRKLFLVGGYSSNSTKGSLEASRRIELRLEFFGVNEPQIANAEALVGGSGTCAL